LIHNADVGLKWKASEDVERAIRAPSLSARA
jgi:hypothetical protein